MRTVRFNIVTVPGPGLIEGGIGEGLRISDFGFWIFDWGIKPRRRSGWRDCEEKGLRRKGIKGLRRKGVKGLREGIKGLRRGGKKGLRFEQTSLSGFRVGTGQGFQSG